MKHTLKKCRITGLSLQWYGTFDNNENTVLCNRESGDQNSYIRRYKSLIARIRRNKQKSTNINQQNTYNSQV